MHRWLLDLSIGGQARFDGLEFFQPTRNIRVVMFLPKLFLLLHDLPLLALHISFMLIRHHLPKIWESHGACRNRGLPILTEVAELGMEIG